MDLNQHIVKTDDNKPFHSHGYAQVAQGDQIGSTGGVSFEQRQVIDRNRLIINNYNRSSIGNSYGVLRAKPVAKDVGARSAMFNRPSLQQHNSVPSGPKRFVEPPSRTFNPYS